MIDNSQEFFARTDGIYYGGSKLRFKGLNWFGFEQTTYVAHGLWSVSAQSLVDFMKRNNFNFVRLPFSAEMALNFDSRIVDGVGADPSFQGKTAGQAMDMIINALGRAGILAMPVMQYPNAGGKISENWYTNEYPPDRIIQAWVNVVSRYRNNPTMFAVDLKNEPHGPTTWGQWIDGVNQMSRAIRTVNPKLLLFVAGVTDQQYNSGRWWGFWGGIISGALHQLPDASLMNKVVFSPHSYGPSVSKMDYFNTPEFPHNLPEVWEEHWGRVVGRYAVLVGEWGGTYVDKDRVWQEKFREYLIQKGLGCMQMYWALNPNSGDTGGVLLDDWRTDHTEKLNLLRSTCPNPTELEIRF